MKVGARKTGLTPPPPVIVTVRPKAVLSLWFHLFYVWFCSIFKCFNFSHFCVSDLFGSVKMAELPPVWERAADSACHL